MVNMFWGLKMEPGKRYSTTVDKSFHISKATLDASTVSSEHEIVSVVLEENGGGVFFLTNLRKRDLLASNLDLNFMTGDNITLFCKGQGVVHLSGYMVSDEDELSNSMLDDEAEEEEEEEVNEEEEIEESTMKSIMEMAARKRKEEISAKRKLATDKNKKAKKKKLEVTPTDSDEDSSNDLNSFGLDDDDDDDSDMLGDEDMDTDEEDSDDDDDEEEDDEDEGDGLASVLLQKNKKSKLPQSPNDQQQNKKGQKQSVTPNKTPNGVASPQQKQVQAGKKEEVKKSQEKQKQPQQAAEVSLTGGVKTKDIKVGAGQPSKPGKSVSVYYTGRLKSNGKVFDSVKQGPGFKFKVGKGEVIKGWDIGVSGMKPGGKRIITCPPQVAYGQKGAPPQIPPNSTLVFEVELLAVH